MIIEIKVNVMCLNQPETTPCLWSVEKLSSTKPVPGAKKVGDCCVTEWAERREPAEKERY